MKQIKNKNKLVKKVTVAILWIALGIFIVGFFFWKYPYHTSPNYKNDLAQENPPFPNCYKIEESYTDEIVPISNESKTLQLRYLWDDPSYKKRYSPYFRTVYVGNYSAWKDMDDKSKATFIESFSKEVNKTVKVTDIFFVTCDPKSTIIGYYGNYDGEEQIHFDWE